MAKTFSNLKQGLGLLDFISIGKYKNCRVDSIVDMDDAYLRYMQQEKVLYFAPEVIKILQEKFNTDFTDEEELTDKYNPQDYQELVFEDVPF